MPRPRAVIGAESATEAKIVRSTRSSTASRASTAAIRARCARSASARACCPAPRHGAFHTRRDSGRSLPRRSAPHAMSRSSTRCRREYRERFMMHYNFPPYSTGETAASAVQASRDRPWPACKRHCSRCCPRRKNSRIRCVWSRDHRNRTAQSSMASVLRRRLALRDAGVPLRRTWRYRHGPHQGRQSLCGADRHPG